MLRAALYLRYLLLVGSLAGLCGAVLMFAEAAMKLGAGFRILAGQTPNEGKAVIASVMGATDACLFGIVLFVFAYSVAFGFVFDLTPSVRDRLPAWMRAQGVHELKQTLVQVILVYLIVDFATDIAEGEDHLTWETLVMPLAILLIAGALRLMSEPAEPHHLPGGR